MTALAVLVFLGAPGTALADGGEFAGFRGDGDRLFTNVDPVVRWREYTYKEERQGRQNAHVPDQRRWENLVWKTDLPFWGNRGPVVVNGRAYLCQDMDYL